MTTVDHHHRAIECPPAAQQWLPVLRTLHEAAAEHCSHALAHVLHRSTTVRLTGVDDVAYGDFVYSLEQPTFVSVLSGGDRSTRLALEINHSILFPLLDCLLGGKPETSSLLAPHRELTQIERRLAARLVSAIVEPLATAWPNVSAGEKTPEQTSQPSSVPSANYCLAIERVESDPAQARLANSADRVVLVSFEIALGVARGLLNVCLPWPAVLALIGELPEPFVSDVPADSAAEVSGNEFAGQDLESSEAVSPETIPPVSHRRGQLVELVVELDGGHISHEDLQALQVGDIITTSQLADEPLVATVDGQPRFLVRPGSLGGQKAIEVQREIAEPASEAPRRAG